MVVMNEIWQQINEIDTRFFLLINANYSPIGDFCMFWISNKWIWLPLYFYFLYLIFKKLERFDFKLIIIIALLIGCTDMFCSLLLKPTFKRLRPCHQTTLKSKVHTVENCGGQYGFASSHAGNTFAIATFLYLWFNKRYKFLLLFLWATLVSYSRIYLGVHFPLDILVGAIIGIIFGNIAYKFCMKSSILK